MRQLQSIMERKALNFDQNNKELHLILAKDC